VALGSIAAYTFVLVAVLGLARGRMAASPRGARVWRALHCLAYVGWASAIWHGFLSGTDSGAGWVRLIYLASLVAVLASVAARLAMVRTADNRLLTRHPVAGSRRAVPEPGPAVPEVTR
jgi:DMSO/TMAO reductase YedYZ heme-binding membrane subunit